MADSSFYSSPSLNLPQSHMGYPQQYFNYQRPSPQQYPLSPSHPLSASSRTMAIDQSTSARTQVHSPFGEPRSIPARLRVDNIESQDHDYSGMGTPQTHDSNFPLSSTASSDPSGSADSPPPWDTPSSSFQFTEPRVPGTQESGGSNRTKQERKDIEARCRRKVRSALEDLKHALINLGLPPSQASSKAKFYGHAINFVTNLKKDRDVLMEQNRILQEENQKLLRAIQDNASYVQASHPSMPSSFSVPSHAHAHLHQRYV